MIKRDYERRHEFCARLAAENDSNTWDNFWAVDALHRLNMRLHTLSERSCNGEGWGRRGVWNDKDEARFNKSWDNAIIKVKTIFSAFGEFDVTEQYDPRGWGMFEAKSKKTGHVFRVDW